MSIFKSEKWFLRRIDNDPHRLAGRIGSSKAGAQRKLLKHLGLRGSGLPWLPAMCVSAQFPGWKAGRIAPPCPLGKDSGRVNSALRWYLPLIFPETSSRSVNCPLLLCIPTTACPGSVRFQQAAILAQAQVQVRSSWQLMKSQVLVCLEIQIITFLHICIVLYCCCGLGLLHPHLI